MKTESEQGKRLIRLPQKPVRPELQFSVPCGRVEGGDDGTYDFIGIFCTNTAPGETTRSLVIANAWINGQGEHEEQIGILRPDLSTGHICAPITFVLDHLEHCDVHLIKFAAVDLDEDGYWWVVITLDGDEVIRYPLAVSTQPGGPQGLTTKKYLFQRYAAGSHG